MSDTTDDEFVQYLLEQGGGLLRTVARYTAEDSSVLFLREDVADEDAAQRLQAIIESSRAENARAGRLEHLHGEDGRLNCVVRSFERGVEMHFVTGDDEGVIVGFDPDAATNLHDFVGECLEHLDVAR